jgi:two-component system cell cycle response regulator DivK
MLLQGKRILIVDDDLENRVIAQLLLEEQGAILFFDRWGKQTSLRLHSLLPIDLILLDLMFPHSITGFDIFDQIHAVPEFSAIPVVAFSASDASASLPRARAQGFAGYIAKPISFHMFTTQVADILKGEAVWQAR